MPTSLRLFLAGLLFAFMTIPAQAQSPEQTLATVYNYLKVSDNLSTSGQIAYDQIEAIKEAGFDVVINLAPANDNANALEGYLVAEQGMTYVQIPVNWQQPSPRDLQMFFDVMEMNTDRKVYVHCFANMRVSAFVYLYRTLKQGISEEDALADLHAIWDPMEQQQWATFINNAKDLHTNAD